MDEKRTMQDWLNTAVSGIRFKPDRAVVEQELQEHLEDKIEDLERIFHLPHEEAEEMALGQMGDAAEIGREMAKIHKPWLGLVWRLSQLLLAGMMVALVVLTAMGLEGFWLDVKARQKGYMTVQEEFEQIMEADASALRVKEGTAAEIGGFTVSIPRGVLRGENGTKNLYLEVWVTSPFFWEKAWLEPEGITLTDSLGNSYDVMEVREQDGKRTNGYSQNWDSRFGSQCFLTLWDFGQEAEWVRLDYEYLEQSFTLTVALEEVEQS